jgi:(5-formylfuran-3-yl)methyl phosphate synthase
MRLLVSVASAAEAFDAIEGNADVIDAKNPLAGPLGAVTLQVLSEIHSVVGSTRPLSAALGDASDEVALERSASAFVTRGAVLIKVGFAGIAGASRVAALVAAAVRGAGVGAARLAAQGAPPSACEPCFRPGGVVAVAYADVHRTSSLPPASLVDIAARGGARGVLLDTADKRGPGLRGLMTPKALTAWVKAAHGAGLLVALAGKLTVDDFPLVRDAGADIAAVRGAACRGGRFGRIAKARVRLLQAHVADHRAIAMRSAST